MAGSTTGPSTSIGYTLAYGNAAIALGAPATFSRTGVIGQSVDLTLEFERGIEGYAFTFG